MLLKYSGSREVLDWGWEGSEGLALPSSTCDFQGHLRQPKERLTGPSPLQSHRRCGCLSGKMKGQSD